MKRQVSYKLALRPALSTAIFFTLSCVHTQNDSTKEMLSYNDTVLTPCDKLKQECFNLLRDNSDEIARIVKAGSQETDPSPSDILAAVDFTAKLYASEQDIRQNCAETFALYERERDDLVNLLIFKEIGKEVVRQL